MTLIQAIIYGAIQGITEFLPISSTAHLVLLPWFMGWNDPGLAFDVALHAGTFIALIWYFRTEWIALIRATFRIIGGQRTGSDERMVMLIAMASVPGALAGFFGQELVETYLRSPLVIAFTLITLALVLVVAERTGRRERDLNSLTWTDAIVVGLAQATALVPGVSRSGVTITAALFCGVTREAAARFSFLLSTPIIAGAVLKQAFGMAAENPSGSELAMLAAGIVTSGLVGYVAIAFMLRFLATNTTYAFIYYRIALGIVVLLAFSVGFR